MANRPVLYLALAIWTASAAHAAPIDPEFRPDGSVRVAGEVFANREAFYRSATFQNSGARCGTPDPDPMTLALLAPSDCSENGTVINPTYNDNRTLIIQVVFHVVKNAAGSGNLTPALIQSQMVILNEDFEALANTPGTNTKVHFVLAKFDPTGKPTNGIDVVVNNTYFTEGPGGGPSAMKTALRWDPSKYLNIYTNQLPGGLLGYATFPFESAGTATDGVVLL